MHTVHCTVGYGVFRQRTVARLHMIVRTVAELDTNAQLQFGRIVQLQGAVR